MAKGSFQNKTLIPAVKAVILLTILILTIDYMGGFNRLEWITYDARMKYYRADKPLDKDIAIVLIDEASLQALNPLVGRFPWPRSVYADLLDFFAMGGAHAVCFDILFSENERTDHKGQPSQNDRRFISATEENGATYHAMQVMREGFKDDEKEFSKRVLPPEFIAKHALKRASGFKDIGNNNFLHPIPGLYKAAKGVGIVEVEPDADSVYRSVRLFSVFNDSVFPAMSLTAQLTPDSEIITKDDQIIIDDQHFIPINDNGHYMINMVGDIKPFSFAGILDSIKKLRSGDVENLLVYPDEFEGKTIFVGASAIGLQDLKTTPLSAKTPGVFLHASVLSNYLENDFLHPPKKYITELTTIILLFITIIGVLSTHKIYIQALILIGMTSAYVSLAFWLFQQNYVIEIATPIVGIVVASITSLAVRAFSEERDKRKVRAMFTRYVSPAVLDQVMDKGDMLDINVSSREYLTILFSDIRSFTSISEKLEAEQVVDLLNTYFSVMSEIAFKYSGTLDKFIGDAVMAFWGAPIKTDDHADKAVMTAVEMINALDEVNRLTREKNYPEIEIGLGINTDNVILGNIGSERKLDYTVIGDGVNLASRLEGLTKIYHCPIIISEYTYGALKLDIPCAVVDMVRVKGKHKPIRIYTPLATPNDSQRVIEVAKNSALIAEQAFECYIDRKWDKAIELYTSLPLEGFRGVFIERCLAYKSSPPDEQWDGVFTLITK